ncbi:Nup170 protein [Hanseniaspora uvarum]|nr:Nup170 protein [Hanseniaspora uvarum]
MSSRYFPASEYNDNHLFGMTSGKITKPQPSTRMSTSSNGSKGINTTSFNPNILSNNIMNGFDVSRFGFGMSLEQQLLVNMNNNLGKVMNDMTSAKYINEKAPLELASEHVDALIKYDNLTPVLDRTIPTEFTKYQFSNNNDAVTSSAPLTKSKSVSIPEELNTIIETYENQHTKKGINSDAVKSGIFNDINRCYYVIGNKLIFWNPDKPESFQTLDISSDITSISLVQPKEAYFVKTITYLLIVATKEDVQILAINTTDRDNLLVYKTELSCKLDGLEVNHFVSDTSNNNIYFTTTSATHIWELIYDTANTKKSCYKTCITSNFISNIIPTKFFSLLSSGSSEHFVQVTMDQTRRVIYCLTNNGNLKAYQFNKNSTSLKSPVGLSEEAFVSRIQKGKIARLRPAFHKIVSIVPITKHQSNDYFLMAITSVGWRVYLRGSQPVLYASFSSYSDPHTLKGLYVSNLMKLPPTPSFDLDKIKKAARMDLNDQQAYKYAQSSSTFLVKTSNKATMIEPGIFVAPVTKQATDRTGKDVLRHSVFMSVPDFGFLKEKDEYLENCFQVSVENPVKAISYKNKPTNIQNNASLPKGYSNIYANQYTNTPMTIDILTSKGLITYKLKTSDEVLDEMITNSLRNTSDEEKSRNKNEKSNGENTINLKKKETEGQDIQSTSKFFMMKYGLIEFFLNCLFNSMKLNNSSFSQNEALKLFLGSFNDVELFDSSSSATQNSFVHLSPKYYAIVLLVSRLFRDVWSKPVFTKNPEYKVSSNAKDQLLNGRLVNGISISKVNLEFYLSSILILDEFLERHEYLLTSKNNFSADSKNKKQAGNSKILPESRSEVFVISSLLELIISIKESLSFLNILYEECEVKGIEGSYLEFDSIFKDIDYKSQCELLNMSFRDLFASGNYGDLKKNEKYNKLIKEICSGIINNNLIKGYKIDTITDLLQRKCGTFCSNHDILGYKIKEHIHKCSEIIDINNKNSNNNYTGDEHLDFQLNNCLVLINKLYELNISELSRNNRNMRNDRFQDILSTGGSTEFITSQRIMIGKCNDYLNDLLSLLSVHNNLIPKAISFLLNVCGNIDKNNLAQQYLDSGSNSTDYRKVYYDERMKLYDLVFKILIKFNEDKAIDKIKDSVYVMIFKNNKDKIFQFTLYDWLIENGKSAELLQLDNSILLEYLTKDETKNTSLEKKDLLWKYYIKLNKFIEAARVLFALGVDETLELNINKRLEYLTRANGLSKTKSINTDVTELISEIELYLSVSNIQFEILTMLREDSRPIEKELKNKMIHELSETKILTCDYLFNEFAEPLNYKEICLLIFNLTNFKDVDVILDTWEKFFEEFTDFGSLEILQMNFIKLGNRLNDNKHLFLIDKLVVMLINYCNKTFKNELQQISKHDGEDFFSTTFLKCGISYEKLYYHFKDLLSNSSDNEVVNVLRKSMQVLIKTWYLKDLTLREYIDTNDKDLTELIEKTTFDIESDPIKEFLSI